MKVTQIFVILITLVIGFICGTVTSTFALEFLDSSAKASLLTYELRQLRNGKIEEIISSKESELEGAVYNHARYLDGVYNMLTWPISMQYDHKKYIQTVLKYRNEFQPVKRSTNPNNNNEQKLYWEKHENEMVENYKYLNYLYNN